MSVLTLGCAALTGCNTAEGTASGTTGSTGCTGNVTSGGANNVTVDAKSTSGTYLFLCSPCD